MAFVPAPNTLEVRLRYTWSTQVVENTLYFQGSAGVTPALATTLAQNLAGWWTTHFQTSASNTLRLVQIYVTDLTLQDSFTVNFTTGLPLTGGSPVESLPYNCAFCVSFRTDFRGRSARGRNYVPGLTEADQANSTILTARLNSIVAGYQALIGAGTFTPGLQWVVVSRFHDGLERITALVRPITAAFAVDAIMDSQRRRLPGRGN